MCIRKGTRLQRASYIVVITPRHLAFFNPLKAHADSNSSVGFNQSMIAIVIVKFLARRLFSFFFFSKWQTLSLLAGNRAINFECAVCFHLLPIDTPGTGDKLISFPHAAHDIHPLQLPALFHFFLPLIIVLCV